MRRKRAGLVAVLMLQTLLMGCASAELEGNCFPLVVTIGEEDGNVTYCAGFPLVGSTEDEQKNNEIRVGMTKGKTIAESKTTFESYLNKNANYNHLKVLVFEDDLLENKVQFSEVLSYLAKKECFPRNTYVCVVDDAEELLELEKHLPQDLGTYLEEYLKNHEAQKNKLLTLGDLLNEKENQMMILYLPYLEADDNYVKWIGYMNTEGKTWKESD